MKLKTIFSALSLTAAVAFQPALAADKLSIAATPVPHAEILEHIQPSLKDAGVDLDIKVFTISRSLQIMCSLISKLRMARSMSTFSNISRI